MYFVGLGLKEGHTFQTIKRCDASSFGMLVYKASISFTAKVQKTLMALILSVLMRKKLLLVSFN